MFRNRSAQVHQFAMVPRSDIPRSSFRMEHTHKTTFDAGYLVPVYVDEVLPGDNFNMNMTAFARLSTPLYPIMDNLYMESFFFFVPNRLLWANWQKFNGEQDNPGDSTSFLVPQMASPANGYSALSIYDYMGLPTVGQVAAGQQFNHNVLHLRAYNLIYNEHFRDENLQEKVPFRTTDAGDLVTDFALRRRGKRHDYFTSALPFPQKGPSVSFPLGTSAPVISNGSQIQVRGGGGPMTQLQPATASAGANIVAATGSINAGLNWGPSGANTTGLIADLAAATAATINSLRQASMIQQLLEKDARGGTRYIEVVFSHFGVTSPDARLQRPEYLGGGISTINVSPIAQTSGSPGAGGYTDTPLGTLGAMGTTVAQNHGFSKSFTEHGVIIGLVSVRADLTYQQGLRRMWSRQTRYDFYWPVFANLGEQAILNQEIYCTGTDAQDTAVFGYQERWAEYRYNPSMITGLFRSTTAGTIDGWHLAQRFTALPTLNNTFIEDTPPLERALAVGASANGQQFIFDGLFSNRVTRLMPMYSVPGVGVHL